MKKTIIIVIVCVVLILGLLGFSRYKQSHEFSISDHISEELQKHVERWAEKNEISIDSISYEKKKINIYDGTDADYSISITSNEFSALTPEQMRNVIIDWASSYEDLFIIEKKLFRSKFHLVHLSLDYIASNGNEYEINNCQYVKLDGLTIVNVRQPAPVHAPENDYSIPDSSTSRKTAKCNYCNGTGKVNGDKCPWCGGSGKTYDNAFNDALGGG